MTAAIEPLIRELVDAREQRHRQKEDETARPHLDALAGHDYAPAELRKLEALRDVAKSKDAIKRAELAKAQAALAEAQAHVTAMQRDLDRELERLRRGAIVPWRLKDAITRLDARYEAFRADSQNHPYSRAVKVLFDGLKVLYAIRDNNTNPFPTLDGYDEHVQRVLTEFDVKLAEERERIERLRTESETERRKERIYNPGL